MMEVNLDDRQVAQSVNLMGFDSDSKQVAWMDKAKVDLRVTN